MRASLRDECEPQMAVDAIPPGGKVLHTVSGHNDTFMQVTDTHIWKVRPTPRCALAVSPSNAQRPYSCTRRSVCVTQLTDAPERDMLVTLTDCPELKELIPTYTREVTLEKFIGREPGKDAVVVELQDVTSGFEDPCIMDIKLGTRPGGKSLAPPHATVMRGAHCTRGTPALADSCSLVERPCGAVGMGRSSRVGCGHSSHSGTRTFLEDEVDNPKVRADLLKKMDALDRTAATETERESVRPRPRCRRPAGALSSVPTPCPTPRGYPNPCRAASRSCATCSSVRGRARALPWAFGSRASR